MRIEGTFLGSAVGRRLFGLVAFVTAVPIAVLAALTYHEMSGILQRRAASEMTAYAKAYGMDVVKRLVVAQDRLANFDPSMAVGRSLKESGLAPMFQSIRVDRLDMPAAGTSHTPDTTGRLAVDPTYGELSLSLLVEPPPVGTRPQLRVGVLDPGYLFGDAESLPARTHICVLSGPNLAVVYCSDLRFRRQALDIASGLAESADDAQTGAGRWTLSSASDVEFAPLNFVAFHTIDASATAENGVALTYLKVAGAFLVVALLLSLTQIRRILVPLERMTEATRRIAAWDFSKPIPVDSTDEFGVLANSFNAMSSNLESQIAALRTMSEIDQDILSHRDVDCVIGRALARVDELLPGAEAAIARFHVHARDEAPLLLWRAERVERARDACADRTKLSCRLLKAQLPFGSAAVVSLPAGDPLAGQLLQGPAQGCLLLPAWTPAGACTLVALGLAGAARPDARLLAQLLELAKRIGVAFDAAEWQNKLMEEARSDSLTGLPNRLRIHELIEERLQPAGTSHFALLFIDLDRFKGVNDGLGHDAGDSLLVQAARRLSDRVRPKDIVARLGGDEFIVLAAAGAGAEPMELAADLIAAISEPYRIGHSLVHVSASIGVVVSPDDGRSREELIRNADTALYQAKAQGRGRAVRFEDNMRRAAVESLSLEEDLRAALDRDQIRVHFQPRVRLVDGSLAGAEALARWTHPLRGAVSPLQFVAMAEEIGLIDRLGDCVLQQVCAFLAARRRSGAPALPMSINLSGVQLRDLDLGKRLRQGIEAHGLRPSDLELEITETALVEDLNASARTLQALRLEGFRIALDDFGTGYSSLSYLKNLPIDVMKIDRSFVRDIVDSPGSRAIAVAIVGIAHTLGMRVVAEGIETTEQAELLRQWGCEEGQGYLYSKPLAPADFVRFASHAAAGEAVAA